MEAVDLMTVAVTAVSPQLSIAEAHGLLLKLTARHLPVVEGKRWVGILSDRDVLLRVGHDGDGFVYPKLQVRDVMTPSPITAGKHTPVAQLASLMLEHKIDAVPIVARENELLGLVTSSDLLKRVADASAGTAAR
jgi:acetoin utilization protein AcuB